jgi:hypothetical protein
MAKNCNNDGQSAVAVGVICASLVGFGLVTVIHTQTKRNFIASLRASLNLYDITLVSAELSRSVHGDPVWHTTARHPSYGVASFSVKYQAGTDPYASALATETASRIAKRFATPCPRNTS